MIKLLALDLDGTVVNESLQITEATLKALNQVQQNEIKVVVATGRMFPSTLPFAKRLGVTNPVVSYQGAMIRDITEPQENPLDHPILFHQTIALDVAQSIVDYVQQHDLHTNVYVNDQLFTRHLNPHSEYYKTISGVTPQGIDDLHNALTAPPSKLMIIDERCEQIMQYLRSTYGNTISVCQSRHNFCEIVSPNVSKWVALQHLMQLWNLLPEEVMAVGDQENDLSMIEHAGLGVAMGSAPDFVKAKANFVTKTVEEDGVAFAIEQCLMPQFTKQSHFP